MKTIFVFFLLLLSAHSFASWETYQCIHLQIQIKNNTTNTCYLLYDDVIDGSPTDNLPFKINPNGETELLDVYPLSPFSGVRVELNYECGEGKFISILSKKNDCGEPNRTEAEILSATDLSAEYQTSLASYWFNQPATVFWKIY